MAGVQKRYQRKLAMMHLGMALQGMEQSNGSQKHVKTAGKGLPTEHLRVNNQTLELRNVQRGQYYTVPTHGDKSRRGQLRTSIISGKRLALRKVGSDCEVST